VLREVDRSHQADWYGNKRGDGGDPERAGEEGQEAILAMIASAGGREFRVSDRAEEGVSRVDETEKADRLGNQRKHNAQSGQNGDRGRQLLQSCDDLIHTVSGEQAGIEASARIKENRYSGTCGGRKHRQKGDGLEDAQG